MNMSYLATSKAADAYPTICHIPNACLATFSFALMLRRKLCFFSSRSVHSRAVCLEVELCAYPCPYGWILLSLHETIKLSWRPFLTSAESVLRSGINRSYCNCDSWHFPLYLSMLTQFILSKNLLQNAENGSL